MHIIVVGCGRVGSGLATSLVDNGHTVSIVDKSPQSFRRLPAEWPGTKIVGFGFDRDDLIEAGAQGAAALAAVTSGDNSNILTARIARENFNIPNVVARIYDPRRAEIYQRLGIPTVATVAWTTEQVHRRLFPETTATEWNDNTGNLQLLEHLLPASCGGKKFSALEIPGKVRLVGVSRAGEPMIPTSEAVGQEGDLLYFAVIRSALREFHDLLGDTESGNKVEK